jgi:hypothetical protein
MLSPSTKLKRIKFHAGSVGWEKYQVSRANVAMRAVGPMIIACSRNLREKLGGTRSRKVIIDVGRNSTANDANINDSDN